MKTEQIDVSKLAPDEIQRLAPFKQDAIDLAGQHVICAGKCATYDPATKILTVEQL